MTISQSIIFENFILPIVAIIISTLILLFFRGKVKDIIADERDYLLAGKSALLSMQIFSWIAVLAMFVLFYFKHLNPAYEYIGMTLAYSVCLLMIMYSMIFTFQSKESISKHRSKFIVFAIILALFIGIFSIRFFSGEDNWVCQNGVWVEHGHPDFPAPNTICN